jgi:predicted DNA-binding protein with PD1-like motif
MKGGIVRSKLLRDGPERTWVLVFERGDAVVDGLAGFARDQGVSGARLWGIGALEHVELGFYRHERKDYDRFSLQEELELLALNGNLSVTGEGPRVHAHVVVGRSDGGARGGHLCEARVGPTLEVFVVESEVEIRREMDDEFRLPLIRL